MTDEYRLSSNVSLWNGMTFYRLEFENEARASRVGQEVLYIDSFK